MPGQRAPTRPAWHGMASNKPSLGLEVHNHGEGSYKDRAYSWLKVPTSTFTLRHYDAKRALTHWMGCQKIGWLAIILIATHPL